MKRYFIRTTNEFGTTTWEYDYRQWKETIEYLKEAGRTFEAWKENR